MVIAGFDVVPQAVIFHVSWLVQGALEYEQTYAIQNTVNYRHIKFYNNLKGRF